MCVIAAIQFTGRNVSVRLLSSLPPDRGTRARLLVSTAVHVVRPKNVFAIAAIDYLKNLRIKRLLNLDSHTVTSQSLCPTFGIGIVAQWYTG